MDILEKYGRSVASYEGGISVNGGENGYFEAIQATDGQLTMGCFWPDAKIAHSLQVGNPEITIDAWDKAGWALTVEGETFCKNATMYGSGMTYATMLPRRLRATKFPEHLTKVGFTGTRFAVTNLLVWDSRSKVVDPVNIAISDWRITIKAVEDYTQRSERLQAVSGIEHTAFLEIRQANETRLSLNEAALFMDDLVPALRLWSGNKLDWLYGEGLDDSGSEVLERLHKNCVVGRYSNHLSNIGWEINLVSLLDSYFSGSHLLDRQTLKELIAYFVDACASGPYFEIRALQLATLLDLITLKLSTSIAQHEILSGSEYNKEILPKLKKAVDDTTVSNSIKQQIRNNLQGLFRTSFRRRLRTLSTHLSLDLNKVIMNRVYTARNDLVHEGRFPGKQREQQLKDYQSLLWTDAASLFRISGYAGELPAKP